MAFGRTASYSSKSRTSTLGIRSRAGLCNDHTADATTGFAADMASPEEKLARYQQFVRLFVSMTSEGNDVRVREMRDANEHGNLNINALGHLLAGLLPLWRLTEEPPDDEITCDSEAFKQKNKIVQEELRLKYG